MTENNDNITKNNGATNSENIFSVSTLLKVGGNFGMRVSLWNPKMRPYIYTKKTINTGRNNKDTFYILNIQKIEKMLAEAYDFLHKISRQDKKVLFVGTNPFLSDILKVLAKASDSYYVNYCWKGGTLTNFNTIRKKINRMRTIENMEVKGKLDTLLKKEKLKIRKEYYQLRNNYEGIRRMRTIPDCVVVFYPINDRIAIKEANILKIPVVALGNSDTNPDGIDYLIPGNNRGKKSVYFFAQVLNDAIVTGKSLGENIFAYKDEVDVDLSQFATEESLEKKVEEKKADGVKLNIETEDNSNNKIEPKEA